MNQNDLSLVRRVGSCTVLALSSVAAAGNTEAALAHVPPSATSFVLVPDLARAGNDVMEALAKMNRPETSVLGKPVEQLKGWLGVGEGFDERGSIIAYAVEAPEGIAAPAVWTVLLPASDAKALAASMGMKDDGSMEFAGQPAFAKPIATHLVISQRAELARDYDAKGGMAAAFLEIVGADSRVRMDEAEVVAWAGPIAIEQSRLASEQAVERAKAEDEGGPGLQVFGQGQEQLRQFTKALTSSMEHGVLLVDVDSLGLAIRPIAVLAKDGALAKSLGQGPVGPAPLSLLPKGPVYGALSIDVGAIGGPGALEAVLAIVDPSSVIVPNWLRGAAAHVDAIQFAAYPSKLGVLAGGLLNDSSLVIVSKDPGAVQTVFQEQVVQMGGEHDGLKFTPSWESSRVLKDGTTAAAFEVKPEPTASADAPEAGIDAMQMMAMQAIFGNRGMHGFCRAGNGSLVVTYSQRQDVLTRASDAQAGKGDALSDDSVVKSMMQWMVAKPDVVGFIGVGQLLKAARQVAGSFGAPTNAFPPIPSRAEPIGFAIDVTSSRVEGAIVVPTAILAGLAEFAARQGGDGGVGAPDAAPAPDADAAPDASREPAP